MARKLNALQQRAYDTIQRDGSIKKGDGWTLATARALATRALVDLEERRDSAGHVHYWRARKTSPAPRPAPSGTHVVRVAVRNPDTRTVTYTQVLHAYESAGVRGVLRDLGVPDRDMGEGSGGKHTTQDGRRVVVWRSLDGGALREFVCGGTVYRLQPHPKFPGTWAAVHLDTGDIVAADARPDEAERRAKEDAAAFHQALRRAQ